MTEESLAQSFTKKNKAFHYAVQTHNERKHGGGKGQSERSYCKHDLIEKFIKRQIPIFAKKGRGCIIDMHAGDGTETPHPQPDFFAGGSLRTTAGIAVATARRWKADVILCESHRERRKCLAITFGQNALIFGNHHDLMDQKNRLADYPWLMVISDPNGYAEQGVNVMIGLAEFQPCSDFIINFNRRSLTRPLGLTNPDHPSPLVRGSYRSGVEHRWMLSPDEWRKRLGKRQVISTAPQHLSPSMESQILLVSNWIAGYGK